MDKYKDPVFARLVTQYLEESAIKPKRLKELNKGIIAIIDPADNFIIYFDMRSLKGPVSISISNKARIGKVTGKTRTPPIKNFKEALRLAQETLRQRKEKKWTY